MDLPHNEDHGPRRYSSTPNGSARGRRTTSSISNISVREKGDGAYRQPIALVENTLSPALDTPPTVSPPADYEQDEVNTRDKYCFLCCACCPQKAHACGSHWRTWFRYIFYFVYALCILGAIPAIVVVYKHEDNNLRTRLWLIGGLFVFLSIPISLQLILLHLINYTEPQLQRHIVRILWMPPIYAVDSWLSLRFPHAAIYFDTLRELYEAYVIYNFMQYLMNYLQGEFDIMAKLDAKPEAQRHLIPVKWVLPAWRPARRFIRNCQLGVLQYTVTRIATTITAFICELVGVYGEGQFNFVNAYSYLAVINNVSQTWALYCLVLFYEAMKDELKPIKPLAKFLCIKLVVFATFWQGIIIAIVLNITGTGNQKIVPEHDKNSVSTALQDLLICIEMIFASAAHHYAFSHRPFIDKEKQQVPFCRSFFQQFDVRDIALDVAQHAKEIGHELKGKHQPECDDTVHPDERTAHM